MKFDKTWCVILMAGYPFTAGWLVSIFINTWFGLGVVAGAYLTMWLAIALWFTQADK